MHKSQWAGFIIDCKTEDLAAPTGQRFCVVNPQRSNFDEIANSWD